MKIQDAVINVPKDIDYDDIMVLLGKKPDLLEFHTCTKTPEIVQVHLITNLLFQLLGSMDLPKHAAEIAGTTDVTQQSVDSAHMMEVLMKDLKALHEKIYNVADGISIAARKALLDGSNPETVQ